jgi:short subunit dehydrogenase-like uncharacterized protein
VSEREHDIVIFGATGFTGRLTAEYLARHAPPGTRGALAGRNQAKLVEVRNALAEINPACADLPLLHADVEDPASMRALAESTRVVITTVGPYINYGEPLVAACAAAGTDYVDLTGEPEFVDRMWLRYNEQAEQTGARIVHSCGWDSIPHDLGTLFTVQQLPEGVPINVKCFVRVGGTVSGGTYHSAIQNFARLRQTASAAIERRRAEQRPSGRIVRGQAGPPRRDPDAGGWALPMPSIDPQHVLRSARALDRYGPEFTYGHYLVVKRLPVVAGLVGGIGSAIVLAQIPPTRKLLLRFRSPGEGPSPERREKSWFKDTFVARAGDPLGAQPRPSGSRPRRPAANGTRVVTEVSGGDPGYTETAKMLAESALCLANDELPERAGQLTTAVAMGQALIDRLVQAGIEFRVVERGEG